MGFAERTARLRASLRQLAQRMMGPKRGSRPALVAGM